MIANWLPDNNSQTTITLKELVESGMCLFEPDDKYPIWEEEHRPELEKKIVDHYAMRQIGFETPGRFKHELNTRMREIMPYYVEMWKTTQFKYNPIENYNMTEEFNNLSVNEGNSKSNALEKFSDTPQNDIKNLDSHLTNATQNDGSVNSKSSSDNNHKGWRKGNIGVTSTQQLIQGERDIILNLDVLIIDELKDLFLGVY